MYAPADEMPRRRMSSEVTFGWSRKRLLQNTTIRFPRLKTNRHRTPFDCIFARSDVFPSSKG
jgi:hypothetical protein